MRRASLLSLALAPIVLGAAPLGLLPALTGGPAGAAFAQVPTGPQATATISQRFELDNNLRLQADSPGTSTSAETRLALGFLEESTTQRFQLGFNTGLRAVWPAGEDFEFTLASPSTATAGWGQDWASGAINANVSYRQRRIDFTRPLIGIFDPDLGEITFPDDPIDLEGDAVERRYDGNVALALATDRPSSYAFTLAGNRIDFSEDAPNLTPRTSATGNATWQLQLTPIFAGTLGARGFYFEADNPADTRITEAELTAGIVYEPSQILRLTAGLGYFERERRDTLDGGFGPRVSDESTGLSVNTSARYDFEDVVVNASLRFATAPDTRIAGNLNATYPLPNGRLSARVFQNFAGGAGGDEIRVTGAGFGVLQELDAVSRLNFDISAQRRTDVDIDEPSTSRIDVTTSLGYDLTERISADIGYRFRWREQGATSADSHAVFFQIGRSFVTGF